jgi:hypothetical protein
MVDLEPLAGSAPGVLILDSGRRDPASWRRFRELARAAGLSVEVRPIDRLLDAPALGVPERSLVLAVVEPELLGGLGSRAAEAFLVKVGEALDRAAGSTVVCLPRGATVDGFRPLLDALELAPTADDALDALLARPFGLQSYDTSLCPPDEGAATGCLPLGLPLLGSRGARAGCSSVLTFGSPGEDFQIAPLDAGPREQLERTIAAALGASGAPTATGESERALGGLRKSAWLELTVFIGDNRRAQQELVDLILRARLDALWISLSPNQYYGRNARWPERSGEFEHTVRSFTALLAARAQGALPRVLAGFQLANNFIAPAPQPSQCARDIHGVDYPDVPAPFDPELWRHELVEPWAALVARWPALSAEVPLSGLVLDLELYLRKISGVSRFLATMGFEAEPVRRFAGKAGVRSILLEHRAAEYFEFLDREAESIAASTRAAIRDALPGAIAACYAPSLSLDGFYRGLYRAWSPLWLFTFDALPHRRALAERGVDARHARVLLLSKIRSRADFGLLDRTLAEHDGIWLNRFSRLVEPYDPSRWHRLEQTPLSPADRAALCEHLGALS